MNAKLLVLALCICPILCQNENETNVIFPELDLDSNETIPSSDSFAYSYEEVQGIVYTTPSSPDWPSRTVWMEELESVLSSEASLTNNLFIDSEEKYLSICQGLEGYALSREGNGVCMVDFECKYQFCGRDGNFVLNLPSYTVDAREVEDIQKSIQFANKYNIQVSVKNTGHNFVGASIQSNSLNILMANYPKDGTPLQTFQDSCGTEQGPVLSSNGGEVFNDVFAAIQDNYHIITGDTHSVGFAGWLQGVGLSHTSRTYGLGIDQVVSFDVVLPSGEFVTADACNYSDIFWALRGGGGGTFGVVTNMKYKLQPVTQIVSVDFSIDTETMELNGDEDRVIDAVRTYLRWWATVSPYLDPRVAGAWFTDEGFEIFILSDLPTARDLFINDLEEWFENEFLSDSAFVGNVGFTVENSWFEMMGGVVIDPGSIIGDGHGASANTRLIPQSMVIQNNGTDVADFLADMVDDISGFGAYWLGGAVLDVPAGETAVHPVMRETEYAITVTSREAAIRLRQFLPPEISGASYNHHSPNEADWRNSLWGPENYRRLLGIKNRYDPDRRFNCWHCVGYQGPEYEETSLVLDDSDEEPEGVEEENAESAEIPESGQALQVAVYTTVSMLLLSTLCILL